MEKIRIITKASIFSYYFFNSILTLPASIQKGFFFFINVACVQTPLSPQKKMGRESLSPIFSEGREASTYRLHQSNSPFIYQSKSFVVKIRPINKYSSTTSN